ncbi:MAG: hypothetical protein AUJ55_05615 [Proteobacteria bacterium CG1_02_64_396]|nr:MAG: hypothetical protein AUJ55_05615 [Proteobacteria bacterium CG1_02_64_396]
MSHPPLQVASLGSGSRGNATVVRADQITLLVDAGFSTREIVARLARLGVTLDEIDAVVLTHEHGDHLVGAGTLARRVGCPVLATQGTFKGGAKRLGRLDNTQVLRPGQSVRLSHVEIHPFTVPHDAEDPIALTLYCDGAHLGIFTDIGTPTDLTAYHLSRCNAALVEFNFDPQMLRDGPYPWPLKERIAGRHGHLANDEAARLLNQCGAQQLQWVAAAHCSQTNNTPQRVRDALDRCLPEQEALSRLLTDQDHGMPWMPVWATPPVP